MIIIDMCSGKGFFSLLAAHEFPNSHIIMIDKDTRMDVQHIQTRPNIEFWRLDIMLTTNLQERIQTQIREVRRNKMKKDDNDNDAVVVVIMVGMHLCGNLSPRAVDLYELVPEIRHLILVPCCLHKVHDFELKQQAKAAGIDPYRAKVDQLYQMTCHVVGEEPTTTTRKESNNNNNNDDDDDDTTALVNVRWDQNFRTNRSSAEGSKAAKNALIVATKSTPRPKQHAPSKRMKRELEVSK
mmetsp:Transcript_29785/g.45152  ORF Transcript_29785/g.45152 Transcript_29785/m.45152 type:complete len:240 (-) Transcript_29785:11-730(-)